MAGIDANQDERFRSIKVQDCLPDRFRPDYGEDLPEGLIGGRIVEFGGAPLEADLGGGGLIVDYIPEGSTVTMRAIFEFSELGMQLTWHRPMSI